MVLFAGVCFFVALPDLVGLPESAIPSTLGIMGSSCSTNGCENTVGCGEEKCKTCQTGATVNCQDSTGQGAVLLNNCQNSTADIVAQVIAVEALTDEEVVEELSAWMLKHNPKMAGQIARMNAKARRAYLAQSFKGEFL